MICPTPLGVHDGVSARALLVNQMPPPAAATQTRHCVLVHGLWIASAVIRPDQLVGGPYVCVPSGCTLSVVGPISFHWPDGAAVFARRREAWIVPSTWAAPTRDAGYARFS